jgi:hypothetical protein
MGQLVRASDSRKPRQSYRVWSVAWLVGSFAKSVLRAVVGAVAGLLTTEVVIQANALAPGGRLPDPLRCDGNGGVLRKDAVWRNTNVRVWFAL